MGKESRSRRKRAQERQDGGAPARGAAASASLPEASPERLLASHGAEPIADLPEPVKKFHLRIVTDILEGHDNSARPIGALKATQIWHQHHDGFAASRPGALNFGGEIKQLACAAGCNHCCRSPVGVVATEAVLVGHFVARTFTPRARLELEQRMAARRAALADADPLRAHLLCPLNVDGRCTVYEVRPYNCRVFHSFDADACERHFVAGARDRGVPIDPVRKQYDRLIAASASVALAALRFDMRMLDFMPALAIALAAGDDRCERLAAGEDLFSGLPTITLPS